MKPSLLFIGPVGTLSGYGAHARDIVTALINLNEYEISIMDVRWGDTPRNFLKSHIPEHKEILDRIVESINKQPDVCIHLTVPNEFMAVGKFNIGITAGIETTLCSAKWLEGLNRMDLIIVPSQHAKTVFDSTSWKNVDQQTGQVINELKCIKPIEVLFEGADTNIYRKIEKEDISDSIKNIMADVKPTFNFLFVGHWLKGDIGEDRKDVGRLINTFIETFKDTKKKPGLILKTAGAGTSMIDQEEIVRKIKLVCNSYNKADIPPIYLIHGELTDVEMNELYNHPKVKAMVSFTKGEGFGRPLLEFSLIGKPVMAPAYSGHLDFLPGQLATLLPGKLTNVHKSAAWKDVILPESMWFTVNYNFAASMLKRMYMEYQPFQTKALQLKLINTVKYTLQNMTAKLKDIMDAFVPKFAVEMPLNLPELNMKSPSKISDKMTLKLPKLKTLDAKSKALGSDKSQEQGVNEVE